MIIIIALVVLCMGFFFYFQNKINYGTGSAKENVQFILNKGDNAWQVSENLDRQNLVVGRLYFMYYLWRTNNTHKLVAGTYTLTPGLRIAEIVRLLTTGEYNSNQIKVTFPEGWTIKDMTTRLNERDFKGDEFAALANKPDDDLKAGYAFLNDLPEGASLEGYLFPDTYFFAKNYTARQIIGKMLDNFDHKYSQSMREEVKKQNKGIREIVTMASVIEGEVPAETDRKIVSGIFWKRISIGQPLQSCATLAYVLGEYKAQYSVAETQTDSLYNTYQNKGLPPGPINSPGISAINAALYPEQSDYLFFLSNKKTGKTVFSKTFEEHVNNKEKNGL